MTVIQDLPIGFAGGGADAWAWQDVLAEGVDVGAPPDAFNSQGQNWGSPPLIPWRLRDADYEPFIQSIRATIAGAGGLRIDHVMGLFRLWWVPADGSAADGAYVRYPAEDLLDIVALESHRAQALVVGEDLGTVEDGVREAMAEHGVLSYRLLWFEDDDPAEWPAEAMAAITTHDLPTVAGLWTGADVEEQREHGTGTDEELERGRTSLLGAPAGAARRTRPSSEAVERAHELLAGAPSMLLSATLDDAVGEQRRPNMPGTTDRPNWSLPLPVLVEDLPGHPLLQTVAGTLAEGVGGLIPGTRPARTPRTRVPAPARSVRRQIRTRRRPARPDPYRCPGSRSSCRVRRSASSSPLSPSSVVVAEAAEEDVVAVATGEAVVPGAPADDVLTVAADDDVVAAEAHDHVDRRWCRRGRRLPLVPTIVGTQPWQRSARSMPSTSGSWSLDRYGFGAYSAGSPLYW